jgi:hypothetical protein
MIDLHMHSTFSDGSLTPAELVDQAVELGLRAIALTDHDGMGGIPELLQAAVGRPLRVIPGVEVSADVPKGTMHMLGYFVRADNAELNESLECIRNGREIRNRQILRKLQALGCALTWEAVAAEAGSAVVGRPHFAQAMIKQGFVKDKEAAFDKYLGKGKPAYVDRRRFTPQDTIRLIRGAGGVPVLAHPFTLDLNHADLQRLLLELRGAGLEGLEVYYSEHTPAMQSQFMDLARQFNLVATGGSDYHGAMTPNIRMGAGFGGLRVPDDVVARLEERRPGAATDPVP